MVRRFAVIVSVFLAALPASAAFRTFPELLSAMLEAQEKGAQGVTDYAMDITLMGHQSTQYFERTTITASDGRSFETFRLVPMGEVQQRQQGDSGMSAEGMQAYADGLRTTGDALGGELDRGMADAGLPAGLSNALGPDSDAEPWASPDPRVMMNGMALFADAAATADSGSDGTAEAKDAADGMARFAQRAEIVRQERVDGRQAYFVKADDLDLRQVEDGDEFIIRSMSVWIDAENLVMLKMHMDGIAKQGGESREMFIERLDRDYRKVPGSGMVMPYRSVVRMGGVLGPEEQAQMEEARQQLVELDEQLASMPPDQKKMMQDRMGPQIEMMRKMVDGGAFEVETIVRDIRVNQGLAGAFASIPASAPVAGIAPASGGDDLVRMVQRDLQKLGYDPGNTDGELTTSTAVAISRFQAENDLEVTGEATPQLAGILAAKAGGGSSPAIPAEPAANQDADALQQAREACLQQKIADAQAAKKKKKRFGKLLGAVGRMAGRHGGADVADDVARVSQDVYDANATADDLATAAEALGISQDDIAECENPM